jgi:hypothetical protein
MAFSPASMAAICSGEYSSRRAALLSDRKPKVPEVNKAPEGKTLDEIYREVKLDDFKHDKWNWRLGTRGPAEAAREKLQKRHRAGRAT